MLTFRSFDRSPRCFALCIAPVLLQLSGCEATGISTTERATFRLLQGHEYCRIVPLPPPTRPPGAERINYRLDDLDAHLAPEYPQSVVLTHKGSQADHRDGRYHSTTSMVVNFPNKTVYSIPREHARWPNWKKLVPSRRNTPWQRFPKRWMPRSFVPSNEYSLFTQCRLDCHQTEVFRSTR